MLENSSLIVIFNERKLLSIDRLGPHVHLKASIFSRFFGHDIIWHIPLIVVTMSKAEIVV